MSASVIDEKMLLAVHSGAIWLDNNYPDWVNKIDLSKLNMNNCTNCVIGQAVGDYYQTISRAAGEAGSDYDNASYNWSLENGFCGPYITQEEELDYYKNLEILWTVEVKKRLS